jgi:vancomycin resistance protein VanW
MVPEMPRTSRTKSRLEVADRRARVAAHQAGRLLAWLARPREFGHPALYSAATDPALPHLVYSARVPITRTTPDTHPVFEAGKRRNVALAAPYFDGLLVAPAHPLSFWRALGRVSSARGFAHGMELRGGCVVPAIGGGLCLLSNALFEMAARCGWTVLERHGHSIEAVPDAPGRLEATVAWPHVDLRFAPVDGPVRLTVRVDDDALVVRAHAARPATHRVTLDVVDAGVEAAAGERYRHQRIVRRLALVHGATRTEELGRNRRRILHAGELGRSCLTCDENACHDRVAPADLERGW